MTEKRRILSPFEWGILLLTIGILTYILFSDGGFSVFERSEEVKMLDRPGASAELPPPGYKSQDEQEKEARVEAMLDDLAKEIEIQESVDKQSDHQSTQQLGQTRAEKIYYERLKKRYDSDDQLQQAADWLSFLKTTHKTYNKIEAIFQEAATASGIYLRDQNVNEVLAEETAAEQAFKELSDWFGLSEEKLRSFAREGQKTIGDWTDFVRQNGR